MSVTRPNNRTLPECLSLALRGVRISQRLTLTEMGVMLRLDKGDIVTYEKSSRSWYSFLY